MARLIEHYGRWNGNRLISRKAPQYCELSAMAVYVMINQTYLTSNIAKCWRKAHLSQDLRQYLTTKFKWKVSVPDLIWWKVIEPVIQKYKESDKIRINKIIYERFPHNHNNNKIDTKIEDKCAHCNKEVEDTDHIIWYESSIRQQMRDTMMSNIKTTCYKYSCGDTILKALQLGMNAWLQQESIPDITIETPNASNDNVKAYQEQSEIGWNQIFRGRIIYLFFYF